MSLRLVNYFRPPDLVILGIFWTDWQGLSFFLGIVRVILPSANSPTYNKGRLFRSQFINRFKSLAGLRAPTYKYHDSHGEKKRV